jgi:hypothetical protein
MAAMGKRISLARLAGWSLLSIAAACGGKLAAEPGTADLDGEVDSSIDSSADAPAQGPPSCSSDSDCRGQCDSARQCCCDSATGVCYSPRSAFCPSDEAGPAAFPPNGGPFI